MTAKKIRRVFLAAPLFSTGDRTFCRLLLEVLRGDLGLEAYWAWDTVDEDAVGPELGVESGEGWQIRLREKLREAGREEEAGALIFRNDRSLLDRADLVVAILDGSDVDSGTAWEIGYAYARGKPIIGIRTDVRDFMDGAPVNVMLEWSIRERGRDFLIMVNPLEEVDLREKLASRLRKLIAALEEAGGDGE